jgi:hypothetical protein
MCAAIRRLSKAITSIYTGILRKNPVSGTNPCRPQVQTVFGASPPLKTEEGEDCAGTKHDNTSSVCVVARFSHRSNCAGCREGPLESTNVV